MGFIIFLLTLLFLAIAFFSHSTAITTTQPFLLYSMLVVSFLKMHLWIFLIGFVFLTTLFFRSNFDKKFTVRKLLFFSTLETLVLGIGSFFLSFMFLFVIAWIHMFFLTITINYNPAVVGILTERRVIVQRLQASFHPPKIIICDQKNQTIIKAIAQATSGSETLYASSIIAAIPDIFLIPVKQIDNDMLMIDNTMILTNLSQSDMQAVSTQLGYLLVKEYFPNRYIKSYPQVNIMNKDAYSQYRKEETKKQLVKIDATILDIELSISSLSATLKTGESKDETNEQLFADYLTYETLFKTQQKVLQKLQTTAPRELGIFENKDQIRIVFATNNPHVVALYLTTLTHEYLHYASYVTDEKRFVHTFFEEGLTEYFTRGAIKNALQIETKIGYPINVAIISEITNMIPESELAELYFTKDEIGLEKALDRVYGDHFYEDNHVLFEALQYTSQPKQVLALANALMKKIGGKSLTEKDLLSSYANL